MIDRSYELLNCQSCIGVMGVSHLLPIMIIVFYFYFFFNSLFLAKLTLIDYEIELRILINISMYELCFFYFYSEKKKKKILEINISTHSEFVSISRNYTIGDGNQSIPCVLCCNVSCRRWMPFNVSKVFFITLICVWMPCHNIHRKSVR